MSRHLRINQLIELFPEDRDGLVAAADRIARLSYACGCAEGAIATTVAIGLVAVYFLWPNCCPTGWHRISALWTVPFILVAAGAGKLIGVIVARLRLLLVYRRLHTKYELKERHVHMYEVGRSGGHRV